MVVIGLTGGIGAGKSTFSRALAAKGAVVVDADAIAREVVEPGGPAYAPLVERFGPGILDDDGRLDRQALARLAFSDERSLADLNSITHPAVGARIAEALSAQAGSERVVVLDVPLMVESGRTGTAGLVVVDCPEDIAISRLVRSRGMDEQDVRRRVAAQASRQDRLARADVVVDNSGPPEALGPQVDRVWEWAQGLLRAAGE